MLSRTPGAKRRAPAQSAYSQPSPSRTSRTTPPGPQRRDTACHHVLDLGLQVRAGCGSSPPSARSRRSTASPAGTNVCSQIGLSGDDRDAEERSARVEEQWREGLEDEEGREGGARNAAEALRDDRGRRNGEEHERRQLEPCVPRHPADEEGDEEPGSPAEREEPSTARLPGRDRRASATPVAPARTRNVAVEGAVSSWFSRRPLGVGERGRARDRRLVHADVEPAVHASRRRDEGVAARARPAIRS